MRSRRCCVHVYHHLQHRPTRGPVSGCARDASNGVNPCTSSEPAGSTHASSAVAVIGTLTTDALQAIIGHERKRRTGMRQSVAGLF